MLAWTPRKPRESINYHLQRLGRGRKWENHKQSGLEGGDTIQDGPFAVVSVFDPPSVRIGANAGLKMGHVQRMKSRVRLKGFLPSLHFIKYCECNKIILRLWGVIVF